MKILINYVILLMLELSYTQTQTREAGGKILVGKAFVLLDTDHIKKYVFGTNELKEIRGASSLLDYLNRIGMRKMAEEVEPSTPFDERCMIYANGGSGLFLIDADKAERFGRIVQEEARELTNGQASVSYVVQELPKGVPEGIDDLLKTPMKSTLELIRYRLREVKGGYFDELMQYKLDEIEDEPSDIITLPSHPFMRPCDSCGVEYASPDEQGKKVNRDPGEEDEVYCFSCQKKRRRDRKAKDSIDRYLAGSKVRDEYLWIHLINDLRARKYYLPERVERPEDFNVFRNFKGSKDYFGLIYADANSMGRKIEDCETLAELREFARDVDRAIYDAVCSAIAKHLKIEEHIKPSSELMDVPKNPLFPFDILLLGGDDVMMVVPASTALDVALTIAKEFHRITAENASKRKKEQLKDRQQKQDEGHTLSVGVVLAPIKYPFGLLRSLVESTLKAAKKGGTNAKNTGLYRDTRINFMTVTGSTSLDFDQVYKGLSKNNVPVSINGDEQKASFYATLRPYDPRQLEVLLGAIREGRKKGLGRTKLHQVREAVLKKNLTTSVSDGLAVLRNWRTDQRNYVVDHIYTLGGIYQEPHRDDNKLGTLFPRVTFPWFADGDSTYRTSLLDFVELYDFVAGEEESQ